MSLKDAELAHSLPKQSPPTIARRDGSLPRLTGCVGKLFQEFQSSILKERPPVDFAERTTVLSVWSHGYSQ